MIITDIVHGSPEWREARKGKIKALRLFTTGMRPAATYGAEVTGDSFPGFEVTLQALGADLSVAA